MKFLDNFKNKNFGGNMIAHHLDPNAPAGDIPFTEPSLEDLVEMVREGKVGKEVLGDDADTMLEYGTPSQRKKRLMELGTMEIPVQPFKQMEADNDISFLKSFIKRKS